MLTTFSETHETVCIRQQQTNTVNFMWFNLYSVTLLPKHSSMILTPYIKSNYSLKALYNLAFIWAAWSRWEIALYIYSSRHASSFSCIACPFYPMPLFLLFLPFGMPSLPGILYSSFKTSTSWSKISCFITWAFIDIYSSSFHRLDARVSPELFTGLSLYIVFQIFQGKDHFYLSLFPPSWVQWLSHSWHPRNIC